MLQDLLAVEEVYLWEYWALDDVLRRLAYSLSQCIIKNGRMPLWDMFLPLNYEAMLKSQNHENPCLLL
jgi:hypothetical protein